MPDALISQAVNEGTQTFGENDQGQKEDVFDLNGDGRVQAQQLAGADRVEEGGDETQAQLKHVQQHSPLLTFDPPRTRRGPFHGNHNGNVRVDDNDGHQDEVQNGEGLVQSHANLQLKHRVLAAEPLSREAHSVHREEQKELGEGLDGGHGPHDGDGSGRHSGCGDGGVPERETNGDVSFQGHGGQVDGRQLDGDGCELSEDDAHAGHHPDHSQAKQVEQRGEQQLQRVDEQQVTEQNVPRALQ